MPPTMLLDSLEGLRRKVKTLSVAYGVGVVAGAAVLLLLGTVLLDYLLNLRAIPRMVLMIAAAGGLGYVLARYVVRPLVAKLTVSDIAGRLEQAFPQFDDRLRSTVDFLRRDIPGSELMKQRVVSEATTMAASVELDRAVITRPVWYSLAGGAGAIALLVLIALFVVGPQFSTIAIDRLLHPFSGHAWPKRVQIDLLGSVPARVPVGQRIDVKMQLVRGDRESMRAIVYYRYGDGPVQQEYMARNADGTYAASLDARLAPGSDLGSLKIWMKSGDDEKQLDPITVVPRLAIRSVEAAVTPPAYVPRGEPMRVNLAHAPAVMAYGSEVLLRVNFNKPLDSRDEAIVIEPIVEDQAAPRVKWDRPDQSTAAGRFVATQSLRFRIRGTDTDSFQNSGLEEYELIVRPDQNPSVQIEHPRRHEDRTPVAVVPLQALAEDDYGITSMKLIVERIADARRWEIDLVADSSAAEGVGWQRTQSSGERLRYRANYMWDLAQLPEADLKPGDVLEYHLLVTDNYNLNGETHLPVPSGKLRISIISQEDLTARTIEDLRTIKGQISEVRLAQNRTRDETGALAQDTAEKPEFDAADRAAAERLTAQQSTVASQSKMLGGKLDAVRERLEENRSPATELNDLARDVQDTLDRAAEGPMKRATDQISNANQPQASPQQRQEALGDAQKRQQDASDQLDQALNRMANIGSLQQTIDRFREILNDQQRISKETAEIGRNNIGKKPEEMSAEDRKALEDLADRQEELSERTARATKEMEETANQMGKSDPASATAMENAARTAQQQQVSPRQSSAAQQARRNQQASAQAQQKQAELGLEMILRDLREAERRKLAELQRQLAELDKQIEQLIRRQAGHNLDNLTLQGPERLAAVAEQIRQDLFRYAQRDPAAAGNPALPQLTTAQEQTERNARDIARSAEAIPNGTETAAQLTRAAGRMERAIVALRDSKLPDAYQPPQVDALAALLEAHARVEEMKEQVDDKIESEQREAIRQQYVRIKEQQEKLNDDTRRINTAQRNEQGELRREDGLRLRALPGDQGGLADEITAMNEALESLGSIVYVWSNQDIARTMNDVKAQLGKPETGAATQAEQKRIVAQLDLMIRNLAEKPVQSEFAQDAGGGGGGEGQGEQQPRLPTEAELRLIKDFQSGVNDSTKEIAQLPEKDPAVLVGLGNRQGELRNLLDQVLQQASRGQVALGPEPDNRDQLPEEADREAVENQELDDMLLTEGAQAGEGEDEARPVDRKVLLVGDRMARSRQRLALNNDPGKTTQIIQERIIQDMDDLIEEARQQQAQARNAPPQQGERMGQPQPDQQQAQNQGEQAQQQQQEQAQGPAQEGGESGPGALAEGSRDIRETAQEWGALSPRQREAIFEGRGETIIEEYKHLIDDYYRSLATKATERR